MTELDANPDAESVFQAAALCKACESAKVKRTGLFIGGCRGCCARGVARGQDFRRVRKQGVLDRQYRSALQQFGLTHEEVRDAANNDRASDQ